MSDGGDRRQSLQSLERGIAVIQVFSRERPALTLGGNAARIFKLDVPHTRLFKPPSDQVGRGARKGPAAGVR